MSGNGTDKVAAAVAAADEPQAQPMRQWQAKIASTGRHGVILLPPDATDGEIAEFVGWVLGPVLATYRAERTSAAISPIVRVAALPPGLSSRKD
jgi:hypothetical protein